VTVRPARLSVVVGATKGIGRHLVARSALRGDALVLCARDRAALEALRDDTSQFEGSVELAVGDALAGDNLTFLRAQVAVHEGPVSVLITAATIGPVGPLHLVDMPAWIGALATNVGGTARIVAELMPALGSDDVIVVFSGGGVGGPNPQPHVSSYTTSKIALMHLVEVAARENPEGPSVVAIAPGSFPTTFTDPVLDADPAIAGEQLLHDVRRTKQTPFDATALDELLDYLESADARWLSGRSLSARRDTPAALELRAEAERGSHDLFRLRRVDGHGVVVNAW
jgi:NAD(P)-dependent dehydrogenase (short-subunit alcohol dehydrogenase family)